MASVTGSVQPRAAPPPAASTMTMASGPYATEAMASRDSAASPPSTDRRSRSPTSGRSVLRRADSTLIGAGPSRLEPVAQTGLGHQVARAARVVFQLAAQLGHVQAQVVRLPGVRWFFVFGVLLLLVVLL